MSGEKTPCENDVAVGALLELAQEIPDAKKVLLKYRHEVDHASNAKALKSCKVSELENTASFLKLTARDDKGHQLFGNKDALFRPCYLENRNLLGKHVQ